MKRFGVRVYKQYFNFASSHFLIFADGTREALHGLGSNCPGGDLTDHLKP